VLLRRSAGLAQRDRPLSAFMRRGRNSDVQIPARVRAGTRARREVHQRRRPDPQRPSGHHLSRPRRIGRIAAIDEADFEKWQMSEWPGHRVRPLLTGRFGMRRGRPARACQAASGEQAGRFGTVNSWRASNPKRIDVFEFWCQNFETLRRYQAATLPRFRVVTKKGACHGAT